MVNIEDFYKVVSLTDLEVHGSIVYFVKTVRLKNKNDYESTIWAISPRLKQITTGPKDRHPKISPDGKYMAFISQNKKNKSQLTILPLIDSNPKILCEREDFSSIKWSNDSKYIYFISDETVKEIDDVKIIKEYPIYSNGKGFIYNKRPTLFRVNLKSKLEKLTTEPYNVISYDLDPEGKEIAAVMSVDGQEGFCNNLYFIKNKKIEKFETEGYFSEVAYSPDGKKLAIVYSDNKKSIYSQHKKLYLLDKKMVCITCNMDRSLGNRIYSDSRFGVDFGSEKTIAWEDNSIYFLITDHGSSKIYKYDLSDRKISYVTGEDESIDDFILKNGKFYFITQKINYPQELYFYDGLKKKLTNFNRFFKNLPLPDKFSFNSSDSTRLEGWVLKNNMGTILEIHGGPKSAYGNAFMFEFYLLHSSGFSIVYSNPRGSEGYDENFALELKDHYGEKDFQDLTEFLKNAIEKFQLSNNIGVYGLSYGGFMVNWIISHTDIFKAAVTEGSISNFISFSFTTDMGPSFGSDQISGLPFENIENYWEKSPLKYVQNIKTSVLIIHSDNDYSCPIEQGLQLYSALKYFKKDVKMAVFPGEDHEFSWTGKPLHRVRRLELIKQWFLYNLQGKE